MDLGLILQSPFVVNILLAVLVFAVVVAVIATVFIYRKSSFGQQYPFIEQTIRDVVYSVFARFNVTPEEALAYEEEALKTGREVREVAILRESDAILRKYGYKLPLEQILAIAKRLMIQEPEIPYTVNGETIPAEVDASSDVDEIELGVLSRGIRGVLNSNDYQPD